MRGRPALRPLHPLDICLPSRGKGGLDNAHPDALEEKIPGARCAARRRWRRRSATPVMSFMFGCLFAPKAAVLTVFQMRQLA